MSPAKHRRRKRALLVLAAGVALLGGIAAFNAKAIVEFYEAWRLGYRFEWMPVSGFTAGEAACVNEFGEILVNLRREGSGQKISRPFLWREDTGYEPLAPPAGHDRVDGLHVTNKGVVLLRAERGADSYSHFLLSGRSLTRIPEASVHGETLYCSLNERGWLAGLSISRQRMMS